MAHFSPKAIRLYKKGYKITTESLGKFNFAPLHSSNIFANFT